jgi:hypothetical protein
MLHQEKSGYPASNTLPFFTAALHNDASVQLVFEE